MTGAKLKLLKCEATALFRVDTRDGERYVLRMHPPHRHLRDCIEAELIWLHAIAQHTDLRVPAPLSTVDGFLLVDTKLEDIAEPRWCAMLAWVPGRHKRKHVSERDARHLGEAIAKLHNYSTQFGNPPGFKRWDFDGDTFAGVAEEARQHGPAHFNADDMRVIEEAIALAQVSIGQLGKAPEHYGLIHADPNLGNVHFERDRANLLDFEVCCYGYYLFDVTRILDELSSLPNADALQRAFRDGYTSHRPMPELDHPLVRAFIAMNLVDYLSWALMNERQLDPNRVTSSMAVWMERLRLVMNAT